MWDKKEKVESYIKMVEKWNTPEEVFEFISSYALPGARILELGSGTGADAIKLSEKYSVTPSDYSEWFIEEMTANKGLNPITLDALKMDINTKFDLIYSNKVLHQFNEEEFKQTINKQLEKLNLGGTLIHTLWLKNSDEIYHAPRIMNLLDNVYIDSFEFYKETEDNDSLIVALRRK